ncbi:unnamed protein product [[Actinomadura] parvosata subsp. kistnae]|nr:unnamed protein product [Actinomadura parvosata subsp. kistnae]
MPRSPGPNVPSSPAVTLFPGISAARVMDEHGVPVSGWMERRSEAAIALRLIARVEGVVKRRPSAHRPVSARGERPLEARRKVDRADHGGAVFA